MTERPSFPPGCSVMSPSPERGSGGGAVLQRTSKTGGPRPAEKPQPLAHEKHRGGGCSYKGKAVRTAGLVVWDSLTILSRISFPLFHLSSLRSAFLSPENGGVTDPHPPPFLPLAGFPHWEGAAEAFSRSLRKRDVSLEKSDLTSCPCGALSSLLSSPPLSSPLFVYHHPFGNAVPRKGFFMILNYYCY
uniref:Uncharacterized protein n=1 Tax=Sphaerodactylus townsendi TaxID=933632 RepID=A0ACB8F2I8_9SAUR